MFHHAELNSDWQNYSAAKPIALGVLVLLAAITHTRRSGARR
jgi:hypothetical protein